MDFASQNLTAGQSAAKPVEFPVWKTVKLGTCKTPDEYRKALKSADRRIGDWRDDILGGVSCSKEEIDLDLVVLSVDDLGFKDGAKYGDICAKAVELGLELCPAEVGPALRLQYGDQPKGEWLRIAMEAITDDLAIFFVFHDDEGLWLSILSGHPLSVCLADYRLVFGRRK